MPLDYTQLSTYQVCPERYRLRYMEQLARVDVEEAGLPLVAGQTLHKGLEVLNKGQNLQAARVAMAQEYAKVPGLDTLLALQPLYQLVNLSQSLVEYQAYMKRSFPDAQVLEAESLFTGQDITWPFPYAVKKDAVWQLPTGKYGIEYKSTSKPADFTYFRRFDFSDQITGQQWSLEPLGECQGILVIVFSWKWLKKMYQGQEPGFHLSISHQEYRRTPEQMADWKQQVGLWMRKLSSSQATQVWGKVTQWCGNCEFSDLCQSAGNPSVRESIYHQVNTLAYQQEAAA